MPRFPSDIYQSKYRQTSINESESMKPINISTGHVNVDPALAASHEFQDAFNKGSHGTYPDLGQLDTNNQSCYVSPTVHRFLTKRTQP